MSAYAVIEFTVKDPDVLREKYGPNAGQTAKEHGGEVLAKGNWEILHGDPMLSIDVRGVAMDARFSLLDSLPTPREDVGESE